MEEKTMVMKILDAKKIQYNHYSYVADSQTTGIEIAKMLNEDPKNVFKTLVTIGKSGKNYVFDGFKNTTMAILIHSTWSY